ncbi:hypothetical protein E2C01_020417 [Portunus trituberculatus]|uniref:Uncharacterized protein n=1 Tax=Portunus trituberculatus TaxID=210409 RepID=A0A5B7E023_PORTR|nr:hypothetical protein [Portunus trituberculatus]
MIQQHLVITRLKLGVSPSVTPHTARHNTGTAPQSRECLSLHAMHRTQNMTNHQATNQACGNRDEDLKRLRILTLRNNLTKIQDWGTRN